MSMETITDALDAFSEYFDNRADADCDQDGYIPNEEMRLLTKAEEAIKSASRVLEALVAALPYIETAEGDEAYKAGAVAKITKQIREAIGR